MAIRQMVNHVSIYDTWLDDFLKIFDPVLPSSDHPLIYSWKNAIFKLVIQGMVGGREGMKLCFMMICTRSRVDGWGKFALDRIIKE